MTTASTPVPAEPSVEADRIGTVGSGIAAFVAVVSAFAVLGVQGFGAQGLIGAAVAFVLVVLSTIDLDRRVLPNAIVLPATALVLAAQLAFRPEHRTEWVAAGVGAGLLFLAAHLVYRAGLGMGDVKLAALLGVALGYDVIGGLMFGSLAAAAYGLYLIATQGASARKAAIPFGPFLAFGALVILLTQ